MTEAEQRQHATDFSNYWRNKGDEKSDSQRFWIDFFQDVLGIEDVVKKIQFEKRVNVDGQTKFIDVYIPETRTLIEQKSVDKDLTKQYPQSGGWMATPYQQGRRYSQFLPVDEAARWIIACNFKSFEIHDMNKPNDPPTVILLDEIRHKLPVFDFMFNKEKKEISHEMEVSVKAGEIVGVLYDKLIKQYKEPESEETLKSLNALCVRLVFCLYAEDAGIFGQNRDMFHEYFKDIPATQFRKALAEFFKILDTKIEDRDKYLEEDNPALAAFPYVNGGLFADESIEIPPFTDELKILLLERASADFDWSEISPTIFGAVFESTLNPETRRAGGMHYTSIENIHKIIDPLFLNDLTKELSEICDISTDKTRKSKLLAFQTKIANLKFLDPACGSGNFLTETYISIRRLENKMLEAYHKGQMVFGEVLNPIRVSIGQFYGIEINDFAVTVAKTALWIAESQMLKDTENIVHMELDFLPLKSYANIVEANALTTDWNDIINSAELSYIMGNPPFIGYFLQTNEQKKEITSLYIDKNGKPYKDSGKIDYVAGWYLKAASYMAGTKIKTAFVSTNSITQGTMASAMWRPLVEIYNINILFAYRTFIWNSESNQQAQVHCVIIGFCCCENTNEKVIFEGNSKVTVGKINQYLIENDFIFIEPRTKCLCNANVMASGGKPVEGGNLIFTDDEKKDFVLREPASEKYFKRFMGSQDYINNNIRWCLWLLNCSPKELNTLPEVKKRVEAVKNFRLNSKKEATRKAAAYPTRFVEIKDTSEHFIVVPEISSGNRNYIPMGYLDDNTILSNGLRYISNATLYDFGIMNSNVHMAWVNTVCGRLKSDYDYSVNIVYNNFPWPVASAEQKLKIENTAQAILDARNLYSDCSLADLYDEISMPIELRRAHLANDRAVMNAYGFPIKNFTKEDCVAELMKMYQKLVEKQ